jgi:hypothetical protein
VDACGPQSCSEGNSSKGFRACKAYQFAKACGFDLDQSSHPPAMASGTQSSPRSSPGSSRRTMIFPAAILEQPAESLRNYFFRLRASASAFARFPFVFMTISRACLWEMLVLLVKVLDLVGLLGRDGFFR